MASGPRALAGPRGHCSPPSKDQQYSRRWGRPQPGAPVAAPSPLWSAVYARANAAVPCRRSAQEPRRRHMDRRCLPRPPPLPPSRPLQPVTSVGADQGGARTSAPTQSMATKTEASGSPSPSGRSSSRRRGAPPRGGGSATIAVRAWTSVPVLQRRDASVRARTRLRACGRAMRHGDPGPTHGRAHRLVGDVHYRRSGRRWWRRSLQSRIYDLAGLPEEESERCRGPACSEGRASRWRRRRRSRGCGGSVGQRGRCSGSRPCRRWR